MQTVTFTCPHCNNLMAATTDMLGLQVRCPTCGGVVVAPAAQAPCLSPEPEVSNSTPELLFEAPPREGHDSIFGEVPSEDALGEPTLPKVEFPTDPVPSAVVGTGFASYPPPESNAPADQSPSPMFELTSPAPAPPPVPIEPQPARAPESLWENATANDPPPPAADDWMTAASSRMDEPTAPWQSPSIHEDSGLADVRFRPPEETLERRRGRGVLLAILAPYSVVMTLVAIYFFWKHESFVRKHHPLEFIPDYGRMDYPKKKESALNIKRYKPELELPDHLKGKLGEPITVGDLQVTPVRVEQAKIRYFVETRNGTNPHSFSSDGLILHLRVKNLSSEWSYAPTDPLFDRFYHPARHRDAKPYTLLEVGDQMFYGGPLDQLQMGNQDTRKYVVGQENDDRPLNPGEERTTVVCTDPNDDSLLPAVLGNPGSMTWRVHLRRGVVRYRGGDVSTTAVIGVEFTAADIQKSTKN